MRFADCCRKSTQADRIQVVFVMVYPKSIARNVLVSVFLIVSCSLPYQKE